MQDGMEAQMAGQMPGAVYVQTNEPENRVIVFRRAPDGTLSMFGDYATGGSEQQRAAPPIAGVGHPHE
ncbi:MAG: hypothetical protein M3P11_05695 [Actinomycetota bacterium]|nr:hypothetical protein [Actinomycetota bacterium]